VPVGFAFAALYLWLARPSGYSLAAGGLLALLGIGLRAAASGHVRKNAQLSVTGPYAYTRNPLYQGSMIIAAGFAVAGRNLWIGVMLVLAFGLIYLPVIRAEERFLRAEFPEYDAYARQVPRLGFRLHKRELVGKGQFSSQLYLQHREYNAIIGAALMMAALVAKLFWHNP
jgi:protein-S-isoprenylcysteine O-methyltransferase Ste14